MRTGRVSIFGLFIILIGAAILVDNLDVAGAGIPGTYWPVLLIAIGIGGGWVTGLYRDSAVC